MGKLEVQRQALLQAAILNGEIALTGLEVTLTLHGLLRFMNLLEGERKKEVDLSLVEGFSSLGSVLLCDLVNNYYNSVWGYVQGLR